MFHKPITVQLGMSLILLVTPLFGQELGEEIEFFEKRIRPVLIRECYGCHSNQAGQARGGLQLDTQVNIRLGGDSGPGIVPGSLDESLIWSALNHEGFEMPPTGKLDDGILRDFEKWIEMGAPDPRVAVVSVAESRITPEDIETGRTFWSLQPLRAEEPTSVGNTRWAISPIDRFVEAGLQESGLRPAPDAKPEALLRRLHFDLVGLPPGPGDVTRFLRAWKTNEQAAVETEVDRLLEDPGFGERWGRHWLDVVRYAESTGRELNATYPNAWRYRDYVIDAFNEDRPYDQFLREQIAGDLLPADSDEAWSRHLVATGFLAMGPKALTEQNGRQFAADLIDEQIDVTTRVILGLSVACARCHDHKFDPIPQSDYYALAGIFQNTTTHYGTVGNFQNRRPSDHLVLPVADPDPILPPMSETERAELEQAVAERQEDLRELQMERFRMRSRGSSQGNQNSIFELIRARNELGTLQSKLQLYDQQGEPLSLCMGVQDSPLAPKDARLLIRGELDQPAATVPRGFVQVVSRDASSIPEDRSGRLELADWLTAPDNPLTARVMANRVWLHLFGEGLVRTPENFGATGQPPTHPELLDWLALKFRESDWSIKSLVRSVATSRSYRMSTDYDQHAFELDPDNRLIWRHNPRRLDAESLRDAMLAISGELDREPPRGSLVAHSGLAVVRNGRLVGTSGATRRDPPGMGYLRNRARMDGPGMARQGGGNRPRQTRFGSLQLTDIDQATDHRSVYLPILRDDLPRALAVFDFAEPSLVVGQRETSNTPEQALYFLNNQFVIDQSRRIAEQLVREQDVLERQVADAFVRIYGRSPTRREKQATWKFFEDYRPTARAAKNARVEQLALLCQSLFASAEFRYLE